MKRFRIKVCGIKRPKDAGLAAESGADMVGMIFYRRSPRFVSQRQAQQIIRALPPVVGRVGVFVDEPIQKVLNVAIKLALDYVQLHGDEPVSHITSLQRSGFRVIKAFTIRGRQDYRAVLESKADLCLLDHGTETKPGGTGKTFDWTVRPHRKIVNLVLSGGLDVDNVARGVRLFDPLMIDVNSGVETGPGVKSAAKMKAFFTECDRIRYGA